MDYYNRCLFCLKPIPDDALECPHCGRKGIPKAKYSDALVPGTILAARYLVGEAVERSDYLIRYMVLDCVDNKKVFVDEFFPRSMASRVPGEIKLNINTESRMLIERAKKAWLSTDAKAAFQENMTVYVVFDDAKERTPDEERTVTQNKPVGKKPEQKFPARKALGLALACFGAAAIISGIALYTSTTVAKSEMEIIAKTNTAEEVEETPEITATSSDIVPSPVSETTSPVTDGETTPPVSDGDTQTIPNEEAETSANNDIDSTPDFLQEDINKQGNDVSVPENQTDY